MRFDICFSMRWGKNEPKGNYSLRLGIHFDVSRGAPFRGKQKREADRPSSVQPLTIFVDC